MTQSFHFRMASLPLVVGPLLIVLGVITRVPGPAVTGALLTIVGFLQMSPALVIASDYIAHRPAPLRPRQLIATADIVDVADTVTDIVVTTSARRHRIRLAQFSSDDRPRVRSQLLSLRPRPSS